jgi:hypothetical protein
MTFTTVMRVGTGEVRSFRQWIEFTGRDHIHHRLESLRIGRVGVVLIIYTVTIWLGLSALALKNTSGINALLQVGQSVIIFLLLGFFMVFVNRQYTAIEGDAFAGLSEQDEADGDPQTRRTVVAGHVACGDAGSFARAHRQYAAGSGGAVIRRSVSGLA